jgi:allantoin racemase
MRILVANANTTQMVTDAVVAEALRHASPGTDIIGETAGFGMGIVSTEAGNAVAGHAALDLLARHVGQVDAAILAISFDTALAAAQELMPFPVVGMTAAALHTACLMGRRFGMVSFGAGSRLMYLDMVQASGLGGRMVGHEVVGLESAAAYLDTTRLDAAVLEAANRLRDCGASSVIIAGAATSGMAMRLQASAMVQLLDGVACAVRLAEVLVGLGVKATPARPLVNANPPLGLGNALSTLLTG